MAYNKQVLITEVGPRDGLQAVQKFVSTDLKVQLVAGLLEAGLKQIQVTSFVHPKKIPQLADAETLVSSLVAKGFQEKVLALVLNVQGVSRAVDSGVQWVEISVSACPVHGLRNTGLNFDAVCRELQVMLALARERGLRIRGSVQCAFGSIYDNKDLKENVLFLLALFQKQGVTDLVLADTPGLATPDILKQFLEEVRYNLQEPDELGLHFHDRLGLGLVNAYAALQCGVRRFDTSVAGLGGCPFLPDSLPNVATENLVNMCTCLGLETGVGLEAIKACAAQVQQVVLHGNPRC